MKKILSLVLAFALALSLCACSVGEIVNRELSRGVVTDNVYTSEYLGLKFTAPEGWAYSTEEEINEVMGIGAEVLGEEYNQVLLDLQVVYDMMATDPYTGSNIIIQYENLAVSGSADMALDDYIDVVKTQMEGLEEITYIFGETTDIALGATDFTRAIVDVDYMGIKMQQVYYFAKIDKYIASMILTITDGSSVETFESCFSALD